MTEPSRGMPRLPSVGNRSTSAAMRLQRLGDDAHVGDTGTASPRPSRCANAPKGTFSSARRKIAWPLGSRIFSRSFWGISLMLIGSLPRKTRCCLSMEIDQPLLGDFFHGLSFPHSDLDARLQDGRRDHEDDQQHQHHVDERGDVDVGERVWVRPCALVKAITSLQRLDVPLAPPARARPRSAVPG